MYELFLDTETTGLSYRDGHKIVEIACIETKDLNHVLNMFLLLDFAFNLFNTVKIMHYTFQTFLLSDNFQTICLFREKNVKLITIIVIFKP